MNQMPQQSYAPQQPQQLQPKPGKGLATAGFILSLGAAVSICIWWLSALLAILGLVFSICSRRHGLGTAGLIISIVTLVLDLAWVVFLGAMFATAL